MQTKKNKWRSALPETNVSLKRNTQLLLGAQGFFFFKPAATATCFCRTTSLYCSPFPPPVWSAAFSLLVSFSQALASITCKRSKLAQWKYPPLGAVGWWLMPEYTTSPGRRASAFMFSCGVGILAKLLRKTGWCCCAKVGGVTLGGRSGIALMDISCAWDRMARLSMKSFKLWIDFFFTKRHWHEKIWQETC